MSKVQANQRQQNDSMHHYNEMIAKWHHDRNLIEGATSTQQFPKLFEEFIELYADLNPELSSQEIKDNIINIIHDLGKKGRIKQGSPGNAKDSLGDGYVVFAGIAEREGFPMQQCMATAYTSIKDRKGKMIDGVFVKEEDLPNDQ